MSNLPANSDPRLDMIVMVLEEWLAGELAASSPPRGVDLLQRLRARAGYACADSCFDPDAAHRNLVVEATEQLIGQALARAEALVRVSEVPHSSSPEPVRNAFHQRRERAEAEVLLN